MVLFLISIRRGVFGTGVPLESFAVEVDLKDSLQTSLVNIVSATDLNIRSYKKIYSGQHIDQCSVGKLWFYTISELDISSVFITPTNLYYVILDIALKYIAFSVLYKSPF